NSPWCPTSPFMYRLRYGGLVCCHDAPATDTPFCTPTTFTYRILFAGGLTAASAWWITAASAAVGPLGVPVPTSATIAMAAAAATHEPTAILVASRRRRR